MRLYHSSAPLSKLDIGPVIVGQLLQDTAPLRIIVAPVEQIGGLPQGSAILYIGSTYYKGIVIFGAVGSSVGASPSGMVWL